MVISIEWVYSVKLFLCGLTYGLVGVLSQARYQMLVCTQGASLLLEGKNILITVRRCWSLKKEYNKDCPGTEAKEFRFIPKESCLVGRNIYNYSIKDYIVVSERLIPEPSS